MTFPTLPAQGSTSWFPWAQAIHTSASQAVVFIHGTNTAATRPDTPLPVVWFGSAQPTNMIAGDVYITNQLILAPTAPAAPSPGTVWINTSH